MRERHFYNDRFEFEGSMDDDGNIYDGNHRKIGHVEGGTIYDNCNIPHGHIDDDGRVTDMCNIPTGKEFGANFVGWGGHGGGMVRNDVLGTGHGNDYGIFSRVKDANRQYGMDGDDYSGDDEEDDDGDYEGGDYGDDSNDDVYVPSSRSGRRAGRRGAEGAPMSPDDAEAGCIGCVCLVLIVIGIWIAFRLCS